MKYRFSTMEDGDAVTFNPDHDVFLFDNCLTTPDSVTVLSCAASVVLSVKNRRITLTGVTVDQLSEANVHFVGYDEAGELRLAH